MTARTPPPAHERRDATIAAIVKRRIRERDGPKPRKAKPAARKAKRGRA